jgi:hypothetical protein
VQPFGALCVDLNGDENHRGTVRMAVIGPFRVWDVWRGVLRKQITL